MAEIKRAVRVAARVQEELARMLTRDVKDPRARGVVISRVLMTDDLRHVKVYVRLLEDDVDKREEALLGLSRATAMLRSGITRGAKLRYAPSIRFIYDAGQDDMLRIEQLLYEVKTEREKTEKAEKKT